MDRRLFVGVSATGSAFMMRADAPAQVKRTGLDEQTEEGVLIEDVPKGVVFNFPPTDEPVRFVDLHSIDDNRRRWALQHITK